MTDGLQQRVRRELMAAITAIQASAGRPVPLITDDTVPFDHVDGFDSLSGVEAAVLFSERVNVEVEQIAFVSPRGGHHMTLREIVDDVVAAHGSKISNAAGATSQAIATNQT